MDMNITMASSQSATWSLEMYKNGNLEASSTQQIYFGDLTSNCNEYSITNTGGEFYVITYTSCYDGSTLYSNLGHYQTVSSICSRTYPIVRYSGGPNNGDPAGPDVNTSYVTTCGTYSIPGNTTQNVTFTIDKGTNNPNYVSLTTGGKISFQLRLLGITNSNYTDSLNTGNLSIG